MFIEPLQHANVGEAQCAAAFEHQANSLARFGRILCRAYDRSEQQNKHRSRRSALSSVISHERSIIAYRPWGPGVPILETLMGEPPHRIHSGPARPRSCAL